MFDSVKKLIEQNRYSEALEIFDSLSEEDKNNPDVMFELAKIYSSLGNAEKSINYLKDIIKNDTSKIYVFDLFFKIYKGNDLEYVNYLETVINKQFSEEINIYLEMAKFFIDINKNKAIRYFEKYIAGNNFQNIDVVVLLAKLYVGTGEIDKAEKLLLKIKNNKDKNYLLELYRVYYLSGKKKEAFNIADSMLNLFQDIDTVHEVSDIYFQEKKFTEFKFILLKYLSDYGNDAKLNFYLSKCYEAAGDIFQATNKLFDILALKQNVYDTNDVIKQIFDLNKLQTETNLTDAFETIIKLEKYGSSQYNYAYFKNNIINKLIDEMQKYILNGDYKLAEKTAEVVINKIPSKKQMIDNILLNEKEILQKKEFLESKPRILEITLTNRCNLKCIMCENIKSVPWELPDNTKNEIIELMPYLEQVNWLGGEVFLYKHFDELFDIAHKYNVKQIISTNALLLSDKVIEKLVDYNVELSISIDGVTKDVYEKIRLGASFEALIAKLELLNKIKHRLNPYMKKRLCVVIMDINYEQLEQFVDFARKYEFDYITFTPHEGYVDKDIFFYKRNDLDKKMNAVLASAKKYNIDVENCMPTQKHMDILRMKYPEEVVIKNIELKKNNKFKFNFFAMATMPEILPVKRYEKQINSKKIYCYSPWQKLFVGCTGYVKVNCNCAYNLTIGTIAVNSLMDIWNSENMINLRHNLLIDDTYKECSENCKENVLPREKLRYRY